MFKSQSFGDTDQAKQDKPCQSISRPLITRTLLPLAMDPLPILQPATGTVCRPLTVMRKT